MYNKELYEPVYILNTRTAESTYRLYTTQYNLSILYTNLTMFGLKFHHDRGIQDPYDHTWLKSLSYKLQNISIGTKSILP